MSDRYGLELIANAMDRASQRISNQLFSPNVSDSNSEPANIVDALDSIAAGLFAIADALEKRGGEEE